jgi:DNA-binding transcriptional MerR regulator
MKKLYYSIGEICDLLGVEQHIIRYWEKELPLLKAKKNRAGNRIYMNDDLELLTLINNLINTKGQSIKLINHNFSEFKTKANILKNKQNIENQFASVPDIPSKKKDARINTTEISDDIKLLIQNEIEDILSVLRSS